MSSRRRPLGQPVAATRVLGGLSDRGPLTLLYHPNAWISDAGAFEAFNQPWKAEESRLPTDAAWGVMNQDRVPYPVFSLWYDPPKVKLKTRFFEALCDQARLIGVWPPSDPLAGIEADLRLARALTVRRAA